MGNYLVGGCLNKDMLAAALEEKVGLPIKERTHG